MGTVLLEREPQLDALTGWWGEAAAGEGRLVFVAGEAGVGKTSLVRRFCAGLPPDAGVVSGSCEALATPVPLGPLVDMADAVPSLAEALSAGVDVIQVRRALLDELGRHSGGTLVVVEDAHWADEATLDLLRHVGRRLSGRRTMVLVTYRDDEVGRAHPLRVLMGDSATIPEVRRLRLRPLSVDGVAHLAEGSALDPSQLYQRTGGNPFFVTEVLAGGSSAVPGSVTDAVLARASRLGQEAREVLDAAACLGGRCTPALVEEVSGQGSEAVDECLETGMLLLDGHELTFRHELGRLAVAEMVPARRAAGYHARALAALRRVSSTDVDPARLADHAERAGDGTALFEYARAAADRAARVASHREAAAYYAKALAAANDQPEEVRAGLLDARALECYMSHDLVASYETAQEALILWRRVGDRRAAARNLLNQANMMKTVTAWLPRAESAMDKALTLLEQIPPCPELAMAWSVRSLLYLMGYRNAEAVHCGEEALAIADELGDVGERAGALLWLGLARVQSGDDTGWNMVEECRGLALATPTDPRTAWATWWPYHVALMMRRYPLAERLYADGIACVLEHDLETTRQFFAAWRARQLLEQGRWDDAEALATTVLEIDPVGDGRRVVALETLARLRMRRGHDTDDLLDEARRLEEPAKPIVEWMVRIPWALAEAAWLSGRQDEVGVLLQEPLVRALRRGEPWSLGETAFWLWRVGGLDEVPAGMAEPYALLLAGDWRASADAWTALGCPFEAARSLACGDDPDALRRALTVFEELGAQGERDEAARRLRRLGVRDIPKPRRTTGQAVENLSPREADVLAMLGEGLRNAEIAAKLFLSERTVEHHVAAVLRKLGVRSRLDAGRLARDGARS